MLISQDLCRLCANAQSRERREKSGSGLIKKKRRSFWILTPMVGGCVLCVLTHRRKVSTELFTTGKTLAGNQEAKWHPVPDPAFSVSTTTRTLA
jgi:hypothetical protein